MTHLFEQMKRTLAQLASPEKGMVYDDANTVHTSKHTEELVAKSVPKVGEHHDGSFQVYMAHKVTKLREIHGLDESEKLSDIFKGCIMYVNGITDPPKEELRRLVSLHGGECIAYRVVHITHLICDHYTDAQLKAEYAKVRPTKLGAIFHVTAKWVVDCTNQRLRLNEVKYSPPGFSNARFGGSISSMFSAAAANSSGNSNSSSSSSSSSFSPRALMVNDVLQTIVYEEMTGTRSEAHNLTGSSSGSMRGSSSGSSGKSSATRSTSSSASAVTAPATVTVNLSLSEDELTLSQQDMMQQCYDLPEDLKIDMLAQFKQVNRERRSTTSTNTAATTSAGKSNRSSAGTSSRSTSSNRSGGSGNQTTNGNPDRMKTRDAMLQWIQLDPADDVDASRAFVPRMKHYLTTLINLQSGNRRPCGACQEVNSLGFASVSSQYCDERNRHFDFEGRPGRSLGDAVDRKYDEVSFVVNNYTSSSSSSCSSSSGSTIRRYQCTCTAANRHIRPPKVVTVELIEDLLDWLKKRDPLADERTEIVFHCIRRAISKLVCCLHTQYSPALRYCSSGGGRSGSSGVTTACCVDCVKCIDTWNTVLCC